MPPAVVQVSRLNNPYYPLPADYPELDDDGQRLARVNACRQWLVHAADPTVQSDLYAASVNFFNRYYLYPDPADDFDPSFYQNGLVKSAPAHFSLLRVWGRSTFRPSAFDRRHYSQEAASIIVCPRGFSKSTQVRITNFNQVFDVVPVGLPLKSLGGGFGLSVAMSVFRSPCFLLAVEEFIPPSMVVLDFFGFPRFIHLIPGQHFGWNVLVHQLYEELFKCGPCIVN